LLPSQNLIVFFKSPELGKVKTRLAAEIGAQNACTVYRELFSITKSASEEWCGKKTNRKVVFYGSGDSSLWPSLGLNSVKWQYGADLGLRMENAIREELNYADQICIIGTDLPNMSKDILENAFAKLNHNKNVFGPALDGGFYLYGTKDLPVNCFTDIPWSDEYTLKKTCRRLEGMHCDYSFIDTYRDVDTLSDLELFPNLKYEN
jgi:uncharacterized protein